MRVPEIVMKQLRRSNSRGHARLGQNRFARLHFGNDDHRQRVKDHRRRFLDVHERVAVMHLA
jgi:hypothetical protein